jgi:hypothetical protein
MGFVWIRSASWPVKWVFDPFLDERDRIVTTTHGLGGPCYGWKKTGDAPHYAPLRRGNLTKPSRTLRLGLDWIRSASWPIKWVFDPFLDERDRIVTTRTASEGHATVGKRPGTHPGRRFALPWAICVFSIQNRLVRSRSFLPGS